MNYAFPHIAHLSEILDAIAGSQADEGGEFAVARRPKCAVLNKDGTPATCD